MTQEDKELLLKDLCSRLPYGVRASTKIGSNIIVSFIGNDIIKDEDGDSYDISFIKPYLRPLSSITEEQKKEISKGYNLHTYGLCIEITNHSEGYWDDDNSCNLQDYLWLVDWLNKNHFDYRGLIEKGLAIDATGLNIY